MGSGELAQELGNGLMGGQHSAGGAMAERRHRLHGRNVARSSCNDIEEIGNAARRELSMS